MVGGFRPRLTAFVHNWFTLSGGRQVADSKVENKTHTNTLVWASWADIDAVELTPERYHRFDLMD